MFCHYVQEMNLLKELLEKKGLTVKMMNGKTTLKERKFIGLPSIKEGDWEKIFKNSKFEKETKILQKLLMPCLLYTSPSPRDLSTSRMPSSA